MKQLSLFVIFLSLLFLAGCEGPSPFGSNVKKEYFTNGQLRSEFIMSDKTGANGLLKRYGPDGELTSTVPIRNGVKNGVEKLYDKEGHVLKTTIYVNGKKHGDEKGYYPNGDVWFSMPYRNGILNGDAYMYRQDGKVVRHAVYKDGKIIN
jgi:antitoxin component YwqK of YwqJK toxin-antitoxin module